MHGSSKVAVCVWFVVVGLLVSAPAYAQSTPDYVPEKIDVTAGKKEPGWHPLLKGAFNLAFTHASNVVGTDDGATWNIGLVVNGGLDWRHEDGHVWENVLKWQLGYAKTPLLDEFFKSVDALDVSSTYLYEIPKYPWLGPFASLRLQTAVLAGYLIKPEGMVLNRVDADGNPIVSDVPVAANTLVDLTDPFEPAVLRESAGVFARPLSSKAFELQARAGIGGWEVFTQEGWIVDSDEDGVVVLKQLRDSLQFGAEFELVLKGALADNVSYNFKGGLMYPFYVNVDTDLDGAELLNSELEFMLGVKLSQWASLDYSLKAARYPLIVDEWQVSNALLLSLTASIL